MAAALYLHNALFASETPSPPVMARRPSYGRLPHDRNLSSVSSTTLRTSTSEHSHPTEPLLHTPYSDSAYHEPLTRQSGHPDRPVSAWETALSLDSEPFSQREQRRIWELEVRKSLRRLRWFRRILLLVIGMWAVYNTVRYFVASAIYTAHGRQIILLILGAIAGLSSALIMLSFTLSALSSRVGWDLGPQSNYANTQTMLGYCSSVCLLGPAIVNFVLVFLWSSPDNDTNSVRGRCNWDIDVVWSGTGLACVSGHATPYGLWVIGASIRLALTLVVVVVYHFVAARYSAKRQPSRRKHGRTHLHSISYPSVSESASISRGARAMVANSHAPVSVSGASRQNSTSTAESESTLVTEGPNSDPQPSRSARAWVPLSQQTRPVVIPEQAYSLPRDAHVTSLRFADREGNESPSSSDGEEFEHRYGRAVRNAPGTYSLVHTTPIPPTTSTAVQPRQSTDFTTIEPDTTRQELDFNHFMGRFRSLIEQVTRDTDAGVELAHRDEPGYYHYSEDTPPSPASSRPPTEDDEENVGEFFPYFGRIIQRMPTIESMGSKEVMSLASSARGDRSVHTLSRPPTRSNTLMTDGSQSPSRRNSLNAVVTLSSPVEGSFNLDGFVSELGELGKASSQQSTKTHALGSKSTASYYTATSSNSPIDSPGEANWHNTTPVRNGSR